MSNIRLYLSGSLLCESCAVCLVSLGLGSKRQWLSAERRGTKRWGEDDEVERRELRWGISALDSIRNSIAIFYNKRVEQLYLYCTC
jgi:hypothetical protein